MDVKEKISVVYITDEAYAMPTSVSIVSAIKNAEEDEVLDFYVLCNGVTDESKAILGSLCIDNDKVNVNMIDVENEKYAEMAKSCISFSYIHVSSTALFKFNLPEILEGLEKVIYVDGDTLIQKSLKELYNWDLEDVYVAAADDAIDKIQNGVHSAKVGLIHSHFFNSGVMLLNLEKMRRDKITEKLIDYRINGKNYFMDQDALNVVLGKRRNSLPYVYNFMSTIIDNLGIEEIRQEFKLGDEISLEEFIDSAVIVHLTDAKKPWIYNMPWYTDIFMKYYNDSPYGNVRLELKSPLKVLWGMYLDSRKTIKVLQASLEKQLRNHNYWNIIKGRKIALYGAGKRGHRIYDNIKENNWCDIVLWCDKNYEVIKEGIVSPWKLVQTEFDYVLITIVDETTALEAKLDLVKKYYIDICKILTICI